MLMSKRVAWLRVLIRPPASHCGCPLYHPRSRRASAAQLLLDLLPKAFWDKLAYSCLPARKSGLHLSWGLLQLVLETFFRLIRNYQTVTFARLQRQQTFSLSGLGIQCTFRSFCSRMARLPAHIEPSQEPCLGAAPERELREQPLRVWALFLLLPCRSLT